MRNSNNMINWMLCSIYLIEKQEEKRKRLLFITKQAYPVVFLPYFHQDL